MLSKKWQERFMLRAKDYASWSKDPSSQIGAVAIEPISKREISGGYNGFPRGIKDLPDRLNTRELKYKYVVHAEANCIYNATRAGISLEGAHLFVWGLPICSECAKAVIQVGITEVYVPSSVFKLKQDATKEEAERFNKWMASWQDTVFMFSEVGIWVNYVETL